MNRLLGIIICLAALNIYNITSADATFAPKEISPESAECIACHKQETPAIFDQWGASKHFRANVSCYECHAAELW